MKLNIVLHHLIHTVPRLILWRFYEDNPIFGLFGPPFNPEDTSEWPESLRPYVFQVHEDGTTALVLTREQAVAAGVMGFEVKP